MKETVIVEKKETTLRKGVLIVGLPGIGLIGQVVGKYLVDELKAEKIAELYSPHFPHQVLMTKNGGMRLIKNRFYVVRRKEGDLMILIGDVQAITPEGQYEVAGKILDYAEKAGVKKIIAVGGYSTGKLSEKRRIFAVVTHKAMITPLQKMGVIFGEARGSIVGAAGLLPALGKIRGMKGMCLMGETHGGYIDVTSAKNMVMLLSQMLSFKVDIKKLEEKAKEGEKIIKKIEEEVQRHAIATTEFGAQKKNISYIR